MAVTRDPIPEPGHRANAVGPPDVPGLSASAGPAERVRPPPFVPAASAVVVTVGGLTLLGHALGQSALVRPVPVGPFMVPLTASGFVLAGIALWLVAPRKVGTARRRTGQALGLLVALVGAAVLVEYGTGRNLGIDLLLFPDQVRAWWASDEPGAGRPALHAAIVFLLAGSALALLDTGTGHRYRPAQVLLPATALATGVAVLGSLYDLAYVTSETIGLAVNANATLFVLAAGVLVSRPELPPLRVFYGPGSGAVVARRMAPIAGIALFAAVLLITNAPRRAVAAEGLVITAVSVLLIPTLYMVLHRTGAVLDRADRRQEDLVNALQDLVGALRGERDFSATVLDSLREGVVCIGPDGTILQANPFWCKITGLSADDLVGSRPPYPWWPPEKVPELRGRLASGLAGNPTPDIEVELDRVDGSRITCLVRHSLVRAPGGEPRMLIVSYRDISEYRRVEAERRHAADQLDTFFHLATDLLSIASTDGYFLRLNPAWERTLGYSIDELRSRPYVEFVHPDDAVSTAAATGEAVGGKRVREFTNRYRCRDGSYRWLSWNTAPHGNVVYSVARDVTEQREAEETRARLATIVDSSDDAIMGVTLDGVVTSWNRAAERTYGYLAEEITGRSVSLIVPPERAHEFGDILGQIARGEPVVRLNTVRLRKDGSPVRVEVSISPIHDGAGNVVAIASITRDMTHRIKAEQRFQQLVRTAPDAMVIVAEDGSIVLVNEQTERLFGYPGSELVGRPVETLIPRRLREQHARHRKDYLATPEHRLIGVGMELHARRRDGSEFPAEISLAPLDTDQGIQVSASVRDVSERRQVEQALAAARDRALAAAELKSKFVATVSHEIRTPMNGVIGLTDLLLDGPLQPEQRRYAEAVRTSSRALLTIINDILDFSKIEAGKIGLATADFDLGRLLEEVVQVAAEAGGDKELEVLCCYPPALAGTLRGDAGRLRQVLLNLVGNAVKFTEHGEVVLRAESAPAADSRRPQVTFSVIDTGIGIAPDALLTLFEPFSQVDASAERQFGGTGLGLAICRQLIELMGGQLRVQSQPGQGSRFYFTLPFTLSTSRSLLRAPAGDRLRGPAGDRLRGPAGDRLRGRRLLVVDGNHTRRQLFTEHARAWGMAADAVPDGAAALDEMRRAAAAGEPYELATIDQRLPGGGIDLAGTIRHDRAIPATRLVLLTAGSYPGVGTAADAGDRVALAKPVGPAHLYGSLVGLLHPDTETAATAPPGTRTSGTAPETGAAPRTGAAGTEAGSQTAERGLILLAEDNDINQLVAVETLAMLGYRTDVARDGVETVELANTKPYQAILMDCQMPKMDGYAAAAEVRHREPPNQHVPIIAMTASAFAEDRQRCLAAGMDDYLTKPIEPERLRAVLDRWTS